MAGGETPLAIGYMTIFRGDAGGERGIRTLGTLLTYTRFPSVRLKPLGHLSCEREPDNSIIYGDCNPLFENFL